MMPIAKQTVHATRPVVHPKRVRDPEDNQSLTGCGLLPRLPCYEVSQYRHPVSLTHV